MILECTPTEFLRNAALTAEHFGFRTLDHLKRDPLCRNCTIPMKHTATAQDRRIDALNGMLTAGINHYTDSRLHALEAPTLFYTTEQVPRSGETAIAFHIFNVSQSIGEAILIQTIRALIDDLGFKNYTVRINSLGDADSATRYNRELTNYLRKRLEDMPPAARELMKEHAFDALMHLVEKEHDLAYRSPNPLEYLSDQSRKHFREIIEYLDLSEIPYEIDPKMLGHHQCYSEALFSVDLLDDEGLPLTHSPLLIKGGRYNEFMYQKTKSSTPAVGAVLVLREKKAPSRAPKVKLEDPTVYVIQLGFGPKIRSLLLIDELRRAGVSVMQNLASDSLSAQLRDAEAKGVQFVVIMGQKEYVEGTVILRDMLQRNQEHVPQNLLSRKLKRQTVVSA